MEFLRVAAAAVGAFGFGALWYTAMSGPWTRAAGIPLDDRGRPAGQGGALPFVIGLLAMLMVAGMMRHIFTASGISTPGAGLLAGGGIGAFLITPWVAMNYAFSMRKGALTLIDGVNSTVGCAVMGVILTLF
jgi:hypothetical protein